MTWTPLISEKSQHVRRLHFRGRLADDREEHLEIEGDSQPGIPSGACPDKRQVLIQQRISQLEALELGTRHGADKARRERQRMVPPSWARRLASWRWEVIPTPRDRRPGAEMSPCSRTPLTSLRLAHLPPPPLPRTSFPPAQWIPHRLNTK